MKKRIYYHDTDCGGIVYYGNYLKFFEEARTEFFEQKGLALKKLVEEGILFVVVRQEIDYKFPGRYADELTITTKIENISLVKIEFKHEVRNQNNDLICVAKTIMACIGSDFKPKQIPEDLKNRLLS